MGFHVNPGLNRELRGVSCKSSLYGLQEYVLFSFHSWLQKCLSIIAALLGNCSVSNLTESTWRFRKGVQIGPEILA